MPSRRRLRYRALQILFSWDARRHSGEHAVSLEDALDAYYDSLHSEQADKTPRDPFVERLVRAAVENVESIDRRITGHAERWKIERMPAVDRNILRLALYEMLAYPDTPPAVVINEALEIARRFSARDSVEFVNGILDAIRKSRGVPTSDWGG